MEKKAKVLAFVVLVGSLLCPIESKGGGRVYSAYKRLNTTPGYQFDGHTVDQVVVHPTQNAEGADDYNPAVSGRCRIKISHNVNLDDQIVYLYHPKTGRFLSAGGEWGTQAVGLYSSFGMPFNIVSNREYAPIWDSSLATYFSPDKNGRNIRGNYGFYSESYQYGHYLGREPQVFAGGPSYYANGVYNNGLRIFTDRGSRKNEPSLYTCGEGESQKQDIFNWDLEEISSTDPNLHLYRLVFYTRNRDTQPLNSSEAYLADDCILRRYYMTLQEADYFNDGNPYYALTSKVCNTDRNHNLINDDEAKPADGDKDYEWQIITRRDLKEKFLLDYQDPYETAAVTGNATFAIDNPDFSRPFDDTFNGTFWSQEPSGIYLSNQNDNQPNGRFFIFQPQKTGKLTQSFTVHQQGVYRVDCQGFSSGSATAEMTLNVTDGVSKSGVVTFENIDYKTKFDIDNKNKMEAVSEVDMGTSSLLWSTPGSGQKANVSDWKVVDPDNEIISVSQGSDVVTASATKPGVYSVYCTDEYGRRAVGVYVVGTAGIHQEPNGGYYYHDVNGVSAWTKSQTIVVDEGVDPRPKLGPKGWDDNNNVDNDDSHYVWYLPTGETRVGRELELGWRLHDRYGVSYADAGDYICVYKQGNGNYSVFYYTVYVNGGPAPYHVMLSTDGGTNFVEGATVGGTEGATLSFKKSYREWKQVQSSDDPNIWLIKKGDSTEGVYVNGEEAKYYETVDGETREIRDCYDWRHTDEGWPTGHNYEKNVNATVGKTLEFGALVGANAYTVGEYHWYGPNGFTKNGDYNTGRPATIENLTYTDAGKYFLVFKGTDPTKTDSYNKYRVMTYNVTVGDYSRKSNVTVNDSNEGVIGSGNNFNWSGSEPNSETQESLRNKLNDKINAKVASNKWAYTNRTVGKYFSAHPNEYVKSMYVYVPEIVLTTAGGASDIEIEFDFGGTIGSKDLTNYVALDNVRITYEGDVPFVLDQTAENAKYLNDLKTTDSHAWIPVYMERRFDNGAWNAFVCPVPLTKGQLKNAFGEGVALSEISENGLDKRNPYRIVFNSVDLESPSDGDVVVTPGHFYIVNPSEVNYVSNILALDGGTTTIVTRTSPTLVALGRHNLSKDPNEYGNPSELIDSYDNFSTDRYTPNPAGGVAHNAISLWGSYVKQTIPAADVKDCYVFATQTGKTALFHLSEESNAFELNAFRFYIKDIEPSTYAKAFQFVIDGVEDIDESAGIAGALSDDAAATDGTVYTVTGIPVKAGQLKRGIYLKNGRKYQVK